MAANQVIEPESSTYEEAAAGGRLRNRTAVRWGIRIADKSVIIVMTVLLTLLAQGLIVALDVPDYTLPSPWETLQALYNQFGSTLGPDMKTTLIELAIGLSCGLAFGLVLGAWIAESRVAQRIVAPYVVAVVSTPLIIFAPLFAIWFGFGLWSKVIMIILMTFGPMTVNAIQGFQALDNDKYELMRSLCANRWEIARKARLPSALPFIFSGMKISAVLSVIAVVAAEFIGSQSGLGHTVYYAQTVNQTDLLVAAALLLVGIGLFLFYGIDWVARKVVYWQ
jgi:ABC-type nitrate/sulfonate/bicarbonate transport system permease component